MVESLSLNVHEKGEEYELKESYETVPVQYRTSDVCGWHSPHKSLSQFESNFKICSMYSTGHRCKESRGGRLKSKAAIQCSQADRESGGWGKSVVGDVECGGSGSLHKNESKRGSQRERMCK